MSFARTFALLAAVAGTAMPANAGTSARLIEATAKYNVAGNNGAPNADNLSFANGIGRYHGVGLEGLSQLDTTTILFKNGVVTSGNASNATMTTGVAITFTNTNSTRVLRPVVNSTLLAAGIGMFVTDQLLLSGPPGSCTVETLVNCSAVPPNGTTFRGPAHYRDSSASFKFDVSVAGTSIYGLAGKLGTDGGGNFYEDLGAARGILNDFTRISGAINPWALGYSWADTNVRIALPNALNPGESVTALYTITTEVRIGASNFGLTQLNGISESQIGYSSFGDPTGGDTPIATDFAAFGLGEFAQDNANAGGVLDLNGVGRFDFGSGAVLVTDPVTGARSLQIASNEIFNERTGEFELVTNVIGRSVPNITAVPEPASWALLLVGFGFVGGALRRRVPAAA